MAYNTEVEPFFPHTLNYETRNILVSNMHKLQGIQDLPIDLLSQSNASSIYEPSDLSSVSSIDESITECIGSDIPHFSLEQLREKYKKEFKAAIKDDYKYMMKEDMLECCKFTEEELSVIDSDDMAIEGNPVCYSEFVKQYSDLTYWLKTIFGEMSQSSSLCLSEKYLNQAYHEELLHRLTRRTQFNEYASQLAKRYPSMKEDIVMKQCHVNELWTNLEGIVSSDRGNPLIVLKDVELDMFNLENWLNDMENNLRELVSQAISGNASKEKMLEIITVQHKEMQPKSKFITSMLQMCDNLLTSWQPSSVAIEDCVTSAKNKARRLQRRWESLFIEILEWQLRIEENYEIKQRGNCGDQNKEVLESNSEDSMIVSNKCVLPSIHEDNENELSEYRYVLNHGMKKGVGTKCLNFYVGTEAYHLHADHGSKMMEPGKDRESCCNAGSDFSDSSGIGISTTTGSYLSKKKNRMRDVKSIDYIQNRKSSECFDLKTCTESESSVLATEDEISSDEMPTYLCIDDKEYIYGLDLFESCESKEHMKESAVSDGELWINSEKNQYNRIQKHKPLLRLNKTNASKIVKLSHRIISNFLMGKDSLTERKKCPQKRRYMEDAKDKFHCTKICKTQSCGNIMVSNHKDLPKSLTSKSVPQIGDQLVPSSSGIVSELNSLRSVLDESEDDFYLRTDVDTWLEESAVTHKYKHSTPKIPKKVNYSHNTFESDSDVEDFKVMMKDSVKALDFTRSSVARTVRSTKKMLDSAEFLEPLATCQTSIRCLKEIEEALASIGEMEFGTKQLHSLIKDWIDLEVQIHHHLKSAKGIILSELDHLSRQMFMSEDILNSVDLRVDSNAESLLNVVLCCKAEKEKLLDIQKTICDIQRNVASLNHERFSSYISQYADVFLKLKYLSNHCSSLMQKSGELLTSYLVIVEPCSRFCMMGRKMYELVKQTEKQLDEATGANAKLPLTILVSQELKKKWFRMTDGLQQMECVLWDITLLHVHKIFELDLEKIKDAVKNLQVKNETIMKSLVTCNELESSVAGDQLYKSSHLTATTQIMTRSSYKMMWRVLQVGLPLSMAMMVLGWIFSNSYSFCKDVSTDWGIVLFPNLQHVQGGPPI